MSFLGDSSAGGSGAYNVGNFYPNAFFDYLSRLMPRRLKSLFRWLEYLYVNCGQVFSVIKKYSEYPITELAYDTENKILIKKLKHINDKHIKIKRVLIEVGVDFFIYGNAFISVFRPFTRYMICTKCNTKHNVLKHPYEWLPQTFQWRITCSNVSCGHKGVAKIEEEKLNDTKKLRVIRWDPKDIDLNWNPVTGETQYFYTIPPNIKDKIKNKNVDKFLLNTLPLPFLMCIKENKIFQFRENKIYHLKNPAPAGINQEWGYPGLLGCLKPFFYTAILRKGNEAVALERLVPWRILHPQPTTNSNDPSQFVNLARWRTELQDAIRKWRRDPNMIKLSPIPVGVTEVGGNARPLLTHQEVAQTEENIITSMGVPKEFVIGGLTHAGGSVTLRMLENQLFTYTEQINDLAQYITDEVCEFENLEKVPVRMIDFKLVDDVQQKQLMGNLYERKEISAETFLTAIGIDAVKERKLILEESVAKARLEKEIADQVGRVQDNLAVRAANQATQNPLQYDPQAVMQVAQQEAMTWMQLPNDQRNQRMQQLEMQDPVLHAVTKHAFSQLQSQQREQGMAMMQQQQQGGQPQNFPGGQAMPVTPQLSGGSSQSTPRAGG